MKLSHIAIARPVATSLLMVALVLAGIAAFLLLPAAPVPQIDYPVISISASMPGADPQTMASAVAAPLERRLGQIADVTEMTSSSSLGSTRISLQFGLNRNVDGASRDIQAAINAARAELPVELRNNPTYKNSNPAEVPAIIIALNSDRLSPGELFEYAANVLQPKFAQLRGVGQVGVGGSALPGVRVELNPAALFRYGVSLEDVRAALAAANVMTPKGAVEADGFRFPLTANDQSRKAADYVDLVIAYRKDAPIRLRDVAELRDSVEDLRNYGLSNGVAGVQIQIYRQPGGNFIDVVDRIKALMVPLEAALPADARMRIVQDRTLTIRTSLHEVELTLVVTILLAIFTVYLFLRDARATLIPSIVAPVTIIGAFAGMYLLNFSLDNLSLMALTISTGFIVDDVVVVVENVVRHMEMGASRLRASLRGSREVMGTVMSMSLSLIVVFAPIFFMGGIVGKMMQEFAATLALAIFLSMILSLTATPMLCAHVLRKTPGHNSSLLLRLSERGFNALNRAYVASLDVALRHRRATLAVLVATIALNVHLFSIAPKGFFPTQDTGRMRGALIADQAVSFAVMKEKLERFIAILQSDPAIDSATGTIGGSFGPGGAVSNADLLITLKPLAERKISADKIIARLRPQFAKVPGANLFLQSVQDIRVGGRSSSALFQYTLQSDDLDALRAWAPRIADRLRRGKVLTDVNSDQQDKGLQTEVTVDRAAASRLGLTAAQIDNTLYDAFGQRQVSTIYEPLNQYHVVMEVAPQFQDRPESLAQLYVGATPPVAGQVASPRNNASSGAAINVAAKPMVPLASVATMRQGANPLQVNHQGNFAAVTISFNLAEGKSLSDADAEIRQAMAEIGAPDSIRGGFSGSAAVYQEALANQPLLIAAALAGVYIILGVLYESFFHPITILSTLPSAGVGAVLALMACNTELSLIAMIGVLLLIGIVKKNAIILVDFAMDARRRRGLSAEAAIREACDLRFRPIMMTTMVALLGALPLAIGAGEGAELRQPLGIAIVGGLFVSQILTLYTTPVVYLAIESLQDLVLRRNRPPKPAPGRIGRPIHLGS
jgi:hydrophobe/amphiphile efflux-1 (HAE1) family protein